MKKYLIIPLILLGVPLCAAAQATGIDTLYDKYSGKEKYTTFEIEGSMLGAMTDRESSASINPFEGVEVIKSVVGPAGDETFAAEIRALSEKLGYKRLMSVNDNETSSTLYYRTVQLKKKTTEFIVVAFGPAENSVICILGNVQPASVAGILGGAISKK